MSHKNKYFTDFYSFAKIFWVYVRQFCQENCQEIWGFDVNRFAPGSGSIR